MDRLLQMHHEHAPRGVAVEVAAAWLHHRFARIHPFADGNGRVARSIASLVFIKAGWFPLVVKRDDREQYIEALEAADAEDLRPLVAMFVEAQRNALIQATDVVHDKPMASTHDAIAAVRHRLTVRGRLPPKEWLPAKQTADNLLRSAQRRFGQVAQELSQGVGSLGVGSFALGTTTGDRADKARAKAAQDAGHITDFDAHSAVVQLMLNIGRSDAIVVSFYALGPRFHGIIGVAGYLWPQEGDPVFLKDGTFLINYAEDLATAQTRFSAWLERVIVEGLNEWRKTL